uniref:Uncharacterized protein n=1 Tax=Lepeophtheirus salmonis TaxID=72036 RepID=A0A0K2U207_LEPSM
MGSRNTRNLVLRSILRVIHMVLLLFQIRTGTTKLRRSFC